MSHERHAPRRHAFYYGMALFYLDLDEIEHLEIAPRILSTRPLSLYRFCRSDYHRPSEPSLKSAVLDTFGKNTGQHLQGDERVYILTQIRTMGFCYNPVSFYYIFEKNTPKWLGVMAEINNTPWDERFCYALLATDGKIAHDYFHKQFHVSPFMPMDQQYDWNFQSPDEELSIHMVNMDPQYGKIFEAHLTLSEQKITPFHLLRCFFAFPLTPLITLCAIYWHALRLRLKGITYLEHPQTMESDDAH